MAKKSNTKKAGEGLWLIIKQALRYKRQSVVITCLGLLTAVIAAVNPYVLSKLVDAVTLQGLSSNGFWYSTPVILVGCYILLEVTVMVLKWLSGRISRNLMLQVYTAYTVETAESLLNYPVSFFKTEKMGKVYEIIGRAGSALQSLIGFQFPYFGVELLTIIISLGFLFFFSPILLMIACGGLCAYVLMMRQVMPPLAKIVEKNNKVNNDAYDVYYEVIGSALEVKRNNTVKQEIQRISDIFLNKVKPVELKEQYFWVNTIVYKHVILVVTLASSLLIGIFLVFRGSMSVGELTAVNVYIYNIFRPLDWLSDMWLYLQSSAIKVKEAHDLFSKKREFDYLSAEEKPDIKGSVAIKNVHFSYSKKDGDVLRGVSIDAPVGGSVALVGKSGSGKSTLVDLIGGFYFPQKGQILIDGVSVRKIDLKHLRSHIAYVSQEVTLFNDTVAKNIAYGAGRKVSQSDIEQAAKDAHCHEFIMEFKKGYRQIVGERGVKLSVGQKQRIAIARAILRDPKILVLDEPTSALDSESEKYITESLARLMQGRTTFIVAHRLSTVRNADQILVMKQGQIIEQGNHEQLMSISDGQYKYLYEMHIGLN